MKHYVLEGEINGRAIRSRAYLSRKAAEKKLNSILLWSNLQVEDDRFPQKHTEEFVCDDNTRFFIRRVMA